MTLQQAIDHFKSKAAMARALGISKPAVSAWDDEIPLLRQYQIQHITKGKLKADQEGHP